MRTSRYESLIEKDHLYIWHPFTQMQEYNLQEPVIIERGEGIMLYDVDGRAYYDGVASVWTNTLGHQDPDLTRAMVEQAHKVAHSTLLGQANVPSIELAEKLIQVTPASLRKVFYCDSGSEAVEIALKMAYQYWQHKKREKKRGFVKFAEAYHGDTVGAVSVGAIDLFHAAYKQLLFRTYEVPFPHCYRCPIGREYPACEHACLQALRDLLQERADELAAVIVEPVQGSSGVIPMPVGYLQDIRALCSEYDVLLIVDEVATGFGRTGTMFACDHEGVQPDLMTVGKGLTGGYLPVAATLTTQEIYDAFLAPYEEQKTFFHGHTFTGNQMGCAVALANLEQYERRNLIAHIQAMAKLTGQELLRFRDLAHVGDIRQAGLMVGIELVRDRVTKEPYEWRERIGVRVAEEARKNGLLTRPLGAVTLFIPPLVADAADIRKMLAILYDAIATVTSEARSV